MIVMSTFEAKARLSELLDRVLAGEEVTITKHRRPVARLVPCDSLVLLPLATQQHNKETEPQS